MDSCRGTKSGVVTESCKPETSKLLLSNVESVQLQVVSISGHFKLVQYTSIEVVGTVVETALLTEISNKDHNIIYELHVMENEEF